MQQVTGKLMLNVIRFTDHVTKDGDPMMRQSYSKDIFVGVKSLENLLISKIKMIVLKPLFTEIDVKDGEVVPEGAILVKDADVVEGVKKYKLKSGVEEVSVEVSELNNQKPIKEDWSGVEELTKEDLTKSMIAALRVLWKDREEVPQWVTTESIEELKSFIA